MPVPAADPVTRHDLKPHPYEGYYRELDHEPGVSRRFYYFLRAGEYAPWHRLGAEVTWHFEEGGPLSVSWSEDGVNAVGRPLMHTDRTGLTLKAGTWQTLVPLGTWTLVCGVLRPDARLSEWELAPDDWYPGRSLP